jgi:hypothetical protein
MACSYSPMATAIGATPLGRIAMSPKTGYQDITATQSASAGVDEISELLKQISDLGANRANEAVARQSG